MTLSPQKEDSEVKSKHKNNQDCTCDPSQQSSLYQKAFIPGQALTYQISDNAWSVGSGCQEC
jgi:hypothetical protein